VKKACLAVGALLVAAAIAVAVLRLLGAGSAPPAPRKEPRPRYRESPILRERVERGELPPVEKRLPEQPLVVPPAEAIGRYDSDPVRPR